MITQCPLCYSSLVAEVVHTDDRDNSVITRTDVQLYDVENDMYAYGGRSYITDLYCPEHRIRFRPE